MITVSSLLLSTVLTGPAAVPAPDATDPFATVPVQRPDALVGEASDLRDPFGPRRVGTPPKPAKAARRADLRDPFGATARTPAVAHEPSADLRSPFRAATPGEQAAARPARPPTARSARPSSADLRDPFVD